MNKYIVNEEARINLGKYIKKYREKRGLGLNQLSLKIAVTSSLISKLENGLIQKISPFLLQEIASGLGINYIELYKIAGYLDEDKYSSNTKEISEDMINVPVYDSVSAGFGNEPDPEPVDFLTLPKSMAEGCVLINVYGDSMEPTLQNGCRILVKKEIEVFNNDLGVFIYNNEAYVKRYKVFENKIFLHSDNRDYPSFEVRETDDLQICGKVIWIMNRA